MRLTRRGVTLSAAAVMLFAAAEFLGHEVLRIVAGAALGALACAVLYALRPVDLSVRHDLQPTRVVRGDSAYVRLRITNDARRAFPGSAASDPRVSGVGDVVEERLWLPPVAPGAESVVRYLVPAVRRGRVRIGRLTMVRTDPLGLAQARTTTGDEATLLVHPRTWPARVVVGVGPRLHHQGPVAGPPLRGSVDMRAIREYVPGDPRRFLHWRASARTGQLMVRDYIDPAVPIFAVLVDTRLGQLTAEQFEEAVEVAASLLSAAANKDYETSLYTTGGLVVRTGGGTAAARHLLDVLCDVEQEAATVEGKVMLGKMDGGGQLVHVSSGQSTVDVMAFAGLTKRFDRVVCIDIGRRDRTTPIVGVRRFSAPDAPSAIKMWNTAVRA